MQILYQDSAVIVAVKPPGVLSTDEPGGMPELLRSSLSLGPGEVRTVHRLDRVVGGVMALARTAEAASELSRQVREGGFEKEYLAVVHGDPGESGTLRDWMFRDKARKMSFVVGEPGKGVQEAVLDYRRVGSRDTLSLVRVRLHTGRTHQIRCQFASHGWDLAGERKYSTRGDSWPLALWSARIGFTHPLRSERMVFALEPPDMEPWTFFNNLKIDKDIP